MFQFNLYYKKQLPERNLDNHGNDNLKKKQKKSQVEKAEMKVSRFLSVTF